MSYTRGSTDGAHALTHNQEVWADRGYAVISGGGISEGPTDFTAVVDEHTVTVGGTETVTTEEETLGFDAPDTGAFWVVVYVDDDGSLNTVTGSEGEVEPDDWSVASEIVIPAPPALSSEGPVTVLGRVLVTSTGTGDDRIVDQTFGGDRAVDELQVNDLDAETAALETLQETLDVDENDIENIATAFAQLIDANTVETSNLDAGSADIGGASIEGLTDSLDVNENDLLNIREAVAETLEAETITPEVLQTVPVHSSLGEADETDASIVRIPENGATNPAGLYWYDEDEDEWNFIEQGDIEVISSGDLSDLNIDASRDWGGYDITNVGSLSVESEPEEGTDVARKEDLDAVGGYGN